LPPVIHLSPTSEGELVIAVAIPSRFNTALRNRPIAMGP
jgi:hypothetical protein